VFPHRFLARRAAEQPESPMSIPAKTLAFSALACLAAAPAAAQLPHLPGYQGRLLRADGTAATGTASVTFSMFAADTGGTALWSETQTLGLSDGYYATFLGLVSPPADGLFDGGAQWLEVRVGSETLVPRQRVGIVPYAATAQNVSGGSASVTSLKVAGQTVVDTAGRLAGPAKYAAGTGISVDDATQTVSLRTCATGQVLVRDATSWQCAAPNPGTVTSVGASAPLSVADGAGAPVISLPRAGTAFSGYLFSSDWTSFDAKFDAATQCGGDLSGPLAAPTVARLQSRPVAAAAPTAGQVLKWSGAQWEPAADRDAGGTVTFVSVIPPLTAWNGSTTPQISLGASSASADGYLASGDWSRFNAKYEAATQCGGDLAGTLAAPQVSKIQGVSVSTSTPGSAQVLRFDGTAWAPASLGIADVGGLSSGYLDLTGTQTIGGAKTFTAAPSFGAPLAIASGGTGATAADANAVFAGPTSGSAPPSFRSLVPSDIPPIDASKVVSGTLGVDRGGTGAAALTGVVHGNGTGAFTAGAVDLATEASGTLPVANGGSGATSLSGVLHGNGTGAFTAGNVSLTGEVSGRLPIENGGTGSSNGSIAGTGALAFAAAAGNIRLIPGGGGGAVVIEGLAGVGVDSPGGTLEVLSSTGFSNTTGTLLVSDVHSAGKGDLRIGVDSATNTPFLQAHQWASGYSTLALNPNGGNVGIGKTDPASRLDVAGDIATSGNLVFGSGPFYAQREAHADFSTPGAGWYRVAYTETGTGGGGRGQNTVTIYTTGGSFAPRSTQIRWWHDWSSTGGLSVISEYGDGNYWSAARVTDESDDTRRYAYLEVNFVTAVGGSLSVQYDGGQTDGGLYSGALTAGAGTVRATTSLGWFSVGGDKLVVHTSGAVGVGTTAPAGTLDVRGTLVLDRGADAYLFTGTGTATTNRYLQVLESPGNGNASGVKAGGILVSDTYAWGNPARDQLLVKGNVGIGATSPAFPLVLTRSNASTPGGSNIYQYSSAPLMQFRNNDTTANNILGGLEFEGNGWYGGAVYMKGVSHSTPQSELRFATRNGSDFDDRMTIRHDGSVGIGTTAPGARLDVAGDIQASGEVRFGAGTFRRLTSWMNCVARGAIAGKTMALITWPKTSVCKTCDSLCSTAVGPNGETGFTCMAGGYYGYSPTQDSATQGSMGERLNWGSCGESYGSGCSSGYGLNASLGYYFTGNDGTGSGHVCCCGK